MDRFLRPLGVAGAASGARSAGPRTAAPAIACAVGLAVLWLVLDPRTADLAAQVYRAQLFGREGFALWDNNWFGGHHLPGYSLLFPALAALVGPATVGLASVLGSTVLLAALIPRHSPGAAAALAWFACAAAGDLFIGRLTFALGVTCALACLVAATRERPGLAVAAGLLTAAASPVSALLLGVVLVAWRPPSPRRWRAALTVLAPVALVVGLSRVFPEGGTQPFALPAAAVVVAISLGVALIVPPSLPAARRGALLYTLVVVVTYLVPSPMGANVSRLGVLAAGPLLALGVARRGSLRPVHAMLACLIAAWQLAGPLTEVIKAQDTRATSAAYFAPLNRELATLPPARVEVVPTSTRWESVYVARRFALARGWETQLDRRYNALFYRPRLPLAAYLDWLRRLAVAYVAVDDSAKERWGRAEAALLSHPNPGLRLLWRSRHWRLYAVTGTPPLVTGGRLVRFGPQAITVAATRPGNVVLRVRFTRFWQAGPGVCVTPTTAGFTRMRVPAAGTYTVRPRWQLGAIFDRPARACVDGVT